MKKYITLFFIFVLSGVALAEIIPPEWEDFAPPMYADISIEHQYKLPTHQYWRDRRAKFEASILSCQEKYQDENLERCYEQLESLEISKNEMRRQVEYDRAMRNRPMI